MNQLLRDAITNYIRAHSNYVRILNLCYVEPEMLEFAEQWLKSASEQYRLAKQKTVEREVQSRTEFPNTTEHETNPQS